MYLIKILEHITHFIIIIIIIITVVIIVIIIIVIAVITTLHWNPEEAIQLNYRMFYVLYWSSWLFVVKFDLFF